MRAASRGQADWHCESTAYTDTFLNWISSLLLPVCWQFLCNFIEINVKRFLPWFLQDENYSFWNEFLNLRFPNCKAKKKIVIEIHNFPRKFWKNRRSSFGVLVLVVVRSGGRGFGVCWASEIWKQWIIFPSRVKNKEVYFCEGVWTSRREANRAWKHSDSL